MTVTQRLRSLAGEIDQMIAERRRAGEETLDLEQVANEVESVAESVDAILRTVGEVLDQL